MKKEDKVRIKYITITFFFIAMIFTMIDGNKQKEQWHENTQYEMPEVDGEVRGFDYDSQQWMYYQPMKPLIGPEPIKEDEVRGYSKREKDMIRDYVEYNYDEILDEYGD